MKRCNFCDGQCDCHLNPPCSFHEKHLECEICGQMVCEDNTAELTNTTTGEKILVCPDCEEASL